MVFQLGLHPGLGAVSASLQSVRRADGHVERCVGVAQGRGEDVSAPQVRARDEARYLHLRGVVALLCGRVDERGDGIVTARGLARAQQEACAAPVSKTPELQAAQVTGSVGPAQPRRKRTESMYSSGSRVGP